jgi:hypothetical protein
MMSLPSVTTTAWTRPIQPPAYNAVAPRTTLQPQPSSASVSTRNTAHNCTKVDSRVQTSMGSAYPKSKKVEWPPAVRDYVRRAFDPANAIAGISSADMQTKLKETISFFAERGAQDTIDWLTYPLPQTILQEERKTEALTANGMHSMQINESNGHTNPLSSPQTKKRHKKNAVSGDAFSKFDQADLDKRRQRFQQGNGSKTTPPWGTPRMDEDEMSNAPVVGTNEALEKSYFRLTAPPKPETVRPLHVLEKTLAMLRQKWKSEKNYNYICNQFKSLRQDLTVQHIKNAFTVKVYEIHARISLEKGDLGEYNQCQTQLKALYAQGLEGKPAEFKAYRILYIVYTCNKSDMNDMLAELTLADKSQPWIKHALDVRSALALGNYHKFFKLYLAAENMGSYLMDMFIERERLNALANISRG